ncbi:MAG: MFS transporter [Acidobacteriota bacterium]
MTSATTSISSERAVAQSPVWKTHTALYFASFVALGLMTAAIGPALPSLAERAQSSLSDAGFLFTSLSLGYMMGSFVGGRLFDRAKGNRAMGAVLIAAAAMMALVPMVSSLWLLIIVVFALGLAQGATDVGGNALLVRIHRRGVGPFMNCLHFSFGLGASLAPALVAQSIRISSSINWAWWAIALFTLPIAACLLLLSGPAAQKAHEAENGGRSNSALIALIAIFLFLYVGAEVGFGGWIYSYARAIGAGEMASGYVTSIFWGAFTIGRLIGIPIAARFLPQLILAGDLAGCLLSVAILLLWPDSIAALWTGATGLGLSMASVFPAMLSLAERRLTVSARVTGRFILGASAGSMFLPWLIGQLFDTHGPQSMNFVILAALVAAVAVFAIIIFHSHSE